MFSSDTLYDNLTQLNSSLPPGLSKYSTTSSTNKYLPLRLIASIRHQTSNYASNSGRITKPKTFLGRLRDGLGKFNVGRATEPIHEYNPRSKRVAFAYDEEVDLVDEAIRGRNNYGAPKNDRLKTLDRYGDENREFRKYDQLGDVSHGLGTDAFRDDRKYDTKYDTSFNKYLTEPKSYDTPRNLRYTRDTPRDLKFTNDTPRDLKFNGISRDLNYASNLAEYLQSQVETLKGEVATLRRSSIEDQSTLKRKLDFEVSSQSREISRLKQELVSKQSELAQSQQEVQKRDHQISTLDSANSTQLAKISQLENESARKSSQLVDAQKRIDHMNASERGNMTRLTDSQRRIEEYRLKLEECQIKLEECQIKLEECQLKLRESQSQLEESQRRTAASQSRITQVERSSTVAQNELSLTIDSLEEEVATLKNQLISSQKDMKNSRLQEYKKKLLQIKEIYHREQFELSKDLVLYQASLDEVVRDARTQGIKLNWDIGEIYDQMSQKIELEIQHLNLYNHGGLDIPQEGTFFTELLQHLRESKNKNERKVRELGGDLGKKFKSSLKLKRLGELLVRLNILFEFRDDSRVVGELGSKNYGAVKGEVEGIYF